MPASAKRNREGCCFPAQEIEQEFKVGEVDEMALFFFSILTLPSALEEMQLSLKR